MLWKTDDLCVYNNQVFKTKLSFMEKNIQMRKSALLMLADWNKKNFLRYKKCVHIIDINAGF